MRSPRCPAGSTWPYPRSQEWERRASVPRLTNAAGTVVQRLTYQPFGETLTNDGSVDFTSRRYTGQIADPETGLYFYNARYYNPGLGRFLSPDTLVPTPGNPQSLNRYSYVENNPVRWTDPSGHFLGVLVGLVVALIAYDAMISIPALAAYAFTTAAILGGAIAGGIGAAMNGGNVGLGVAMGAAFGGLGSLAGPALLYVIRDPASFVSWCYALPHHAPPGPPGCPRDPAPRDGAGPGATADLPG